METAYLDRLGLAGDVRAWQPQRGVDALGELARAHLASVPFENLAIHAGEPSTANPDSVLAKLVTRRRGGICYELNGGLGWLLERLGWSVAYHGGRVLTPRGPGLPLGHLALVVGTVEGGERWLVDVGFGGDLVLGPLTETAPGVLARDADEVPVRQPSGVAVDYLLEPRARPYSDFAGMAWWHSTAPGARFTGALICSATRDDVRHTLSGRRLKVTRLNLAADHPDAVSERELADEAEVLACYREVFGIELATEPVRAEFESSGQRQPVANGSPR